MQPTRATNMLIRHVSVFDALTDREVDAFTVFVKERRLAVGEVLFAEGDFGESLFVLLQGQIAVYVRGHGGEQVHLARLVPGDIIGEGACIDPAPRSAATVAHSPAVLLELNRQSLERMAVEQPKVASVLLGAIIQDLTHRLRDVDRRVEAALGSKAPPPVPSRPPAPRTGSFDRLASRFKVR